MEKKIAAMQKAMLTVVDTKVFSIKDGINELYNSTRCACTFDKESTCIQSPSMPAGIVTEIKDKAANELDFILSMISDLSFLQDNKLKLDAGIS